MLYNTSFGMLIHYVISVMCSIGMLHTTYTIVRKTGIRKLNYLETKVE